MWGQGERGYAMAALLVGMSVMAVLMSAALPVWSHMSRREKEEELIWRGQQYARAIGLFQRKYANTFPPNVDLLVEQRFLRKKYKDPITNDDFQPIPAGGIVAPGVIPPPGGGTPPGGSETAPSGQRPTGAQMTSVGRVQGGVGIQGVISKSKETSIKIYNGRTKYNEWAFVYMATTQGIGVPPGVPQRPGPGAVQRGGATFTPLTGTERRPGVGGPPPMNPAGPRQPLPFGQPPGRPPGPGSGRPPGQ